MGRSAQNTRDQHRPEKQSDFSKKVTGQTVFDCVGMFRTYDIE